MVMTDKNMAFNTRKEKKKKKRDSNSEWGLSEANDIRNGGEKKNLEKTKKLPHKILRSTCS